MSLTRLLRTFGLTPWCVGILLIQLGAAPQWSRAAEEADDAQEAKPSAEPAKEAWDVNAPMGPKHDISIDTRTGTWMNLDVSPDGKEVVFDLLGDLYTVPIEGGEAEALTIGMAWDEQPRFSPDGRWIAFTSDRSGGDNIWVMKRDGTDPRAVTKEDFRLVNSPAWAPDSEYLAVRKHFTSTRSAGAGEMWLYHRSGGEGLQMTKRPNEQKDAGEPAFSPDGRYLYYSQDTTPGQTFEYNKDPNKQIYVIQRLDRKTGETEAFITGPGGSIRPTPSHDGKSLAFVRRVRGKSVVYVADVESGAERPLYDGLDRDMQETWAIHGVYPSMAWTPDDAAIVFWAGGQIRKLNLETREVTEIPFHVHATRTIEEALRFPVDVAPEKFHTKMLRWVAVSPDGRRVAFQTLGHVWIRDLPEGEPRRLTDQNEHFEYFPAFSRDGNEVVYTTWDDRELGSVRIAPASGGEGRVITQKPGHYVEPVFSPDGSKVVYRAIEGGYLVSPEWSHDTGIYWVPADGGESKRVTKNGREPQFGASNDRLFFLRTGDENKRLLMSVDLDGSDEHTHLETDNAVEIRISPDEKWVAFTERFNAWIAPFVFTGRTVAVGPKMKALPVAQASRDAGNNLHWSGDSRRLYWSLGSELFSRDLTDAFAFLDGAPEKLPKPPEHGIDIGMDVRTDVPDGVIALVGARVIPMTGERIIEDGAVVIEGNRIRAVGPRATMDLPNGVKTVDVSGKTILPGWVDVHWHGAIGADEIIPEQNWVELAALAFGVTTIHDPSHDTSEIFAASEMAKAGLITAPRIFSTGTILYGAKSPYKAVIENLDDARSALRRMKAAGAFSVKSYNQPRRNQRQQIIQAARELEMMVVPEGGSLLPHNLNMIVDGHTGIEHSIPVARIYDDIVQLWSQSRTFYTPTLIVAYGGLWGENYWYQKTQVWEDERLLTFVPRELVDARSRRRIMAPEEEFNHIQNAKVAKKLLDAGVTVELGAHGQREGLGAHWEMWMMSQGGMIPMEVLRCATISGARYLGLDHDIGSLEPGKLADLVVLDRNPLDNIRNTRAVRYTMVNGRLFDAATLDEIGNHPRKRQPLYWKQGTAAGIPASMISGSDD